MEEQNGKSSVLAVSIQRVESLILIYLMNQSPPLSCSSVKYNKMLPVLLSHLIPVSDSVMEYLPTSK